MNILLSRSGGIGDCLLTLPLAVCIKSTYPGCSLHILGNTAMLAVARLSGLFDGFNSIDSSIFAGLFSGTPPVGALQSYLSSFDMVVMISTAAPETLQSSIMHAGSGECLVIDPRPTPGVQVHIVSQLLAGFSNDVPENIPMPTDYGIPHIHRESGCTSLIIHPGSGSIKKNWPHARFVEIAGKCGMQVGFVCGPAEIERGLVRQLEREGISVLLPRSLEELQSILLHCGLMLGNDSGTAHFAAALQIPTIALLGPTEPSVWSPLGEHVEVIASPDLTMNGIEVNDVLSAIRNVKMS